MSFDLSQLNFEEVVMQEEGAFSKPEPGGYVCKIVAAGMDDKYPIARFVFDIAEGKHAGHFSDSWGQAHPYAHEMVLSFNQNALGVTKSKLQAFAASNKGFDPFAALKQNDLSQFVGKYIGLVLQYEEANNKKMYLKPMKTYSIADIKAGKFEIPPERRKSEQQSSSKPANKPAKSEGDGGSIGGYNPFAK